MVGSPGPDPGRDLAPDPQDLVEDPPVSLQDHAKEVDACADMLQRWTRDRLEPEQFHVLKDELERRLRRLAGRLRKRPIDKPTTTWRAPDGRGF
ncbi:hypothetical protein GCM10010983_52080 [Caulobacter rhizosphaerae]|nr:hypothetical protein GCM10010983_52080 [Caulobacter rhizosphaerae]